jgi:hypothetical protein
VRSSCAVQRRRSLDLAGANAAIWTDASVLVRPLFVRSYGALTEVGCDPLLRPVHGRILIYKVRVPVPTSGHLGDPPR